VDRQRPLRPRGDGPAANPGETFPHLATYREFQSAVLGRTAKSGAGSADFKFRRQFKEIEEAERQRRTGTSRGAAGHDDALWFGILWPNSPVHGPDVASWLNRTSWPARGPLGLIRPEDAEPVAPSS